MEDILRKVQIEDIILYRENTYDSKNSKDYRDLFKKLQREGKMKSEYEDRMWICFSGIKSFEINFDFNYVTFKRHFGAEYSITASEITEIMKCYVLHICGEYIFRTISMKINCIKSFLTHFGDSRYRIEADDRYTIADFLSFLGLEDHELSSVLARIGICRTQKAGRRDLAKMINYLAIDSELTDMYSSAILSNEEFIRWFPLYFWTKVTFILPLRATEMLVTPYNCIDRRDGRIYLSVRRTLLKGGGGKVFYDVDKDYRLFEYCVPDTETIRNIEKYQGLTACHKRKYLFDFGTKAVNEIMSLSAFNYLLEVFIKENLVGNRKYDYARFDCGIQEFQTVTAGDSRPIAMSNLWYQGTSADICRQLANHCNVQTSYGYYTNVGNTVLATSIIKMQRELNHEQRELDRYKEEINRTDLKSSSDDNCSSVHRPKKTGEITDCTSEDYLYDCLGCRFYNPDEEELKRALSERKKILDQASLSVLKCMQKGVDKAESDYEKVFLDVHTGITRYRAACDIKAKKEVVKWQRSRNTTMTCS